MGDRTTTLLQGGVTNAVIGTALETYLSMDPATIHQYFNDFDVFTSGDWTITNTGSPTNALTAGNGGILSIGNSAASADLDQLTLKVATFAFIAGQQVWFKCRFNINSATNAGVAIGLQNLNTNAFAATDGVWFQKAEASTTINALVAASSTITTSNWGATLANSTYYDVGFYYDGLNPINLYFNGTAVGTVPVTNLPAAATNLALTIAVENGTAAANTLLIDYILAAVERDNPAQQIGA